MEFNIQLNIPEIHKGKIAWVIATLNKYAAIQSLKHVPSIQSIGFDNSSSIVTNQKSWDNIQNGDFHLLHTKPNMYLALPSGENDYLATAFYYINCLWERNSQAKTDRFGRHEFQHSIWAKNNFDTPFCIVNQCFDEILKSLNLPTPEELSFLHLSHDIDSVYGSLMQDGFSILKKKQLKRLFPFLIKRIKTGPLWRNFITIGSIEQKYGFKSSFFWLVNKGKTNFNVENADYKITDPKILKQIDWLNENGFELGLHKSISVENHQQEMSKLPFNAISNRNHFLKFNFPDLIKSIENSNIEVDFSLGYAEVMGYRNGYSLPFVPFNLSTNSKCKFVEVPLTIMDGTLSAYKKLKYADALKLTNSFFEKHQYNSMISVLWHNSHYSDYKYEGYPKLYEDILQLAQKSGITSLLSEEIKDKFSITDIID